MFVVSDLMPPSHFASSAQFAGPNRIPSTIGTTQSLRRVNQGVTSGDPASSKPWLALSQPQQEIMKGRRENQRIKMLHHDSVRGSSPVDAVSDLLRSRYVTVFCFFCLAYREQLVCTVYDASSPSFLKTDGMRDVNSGPLGVSQSGVQKQGSARQKLKG